MFRKPRGPDSGFEFYQSMGRRRTYFDTSSAGHAIDEAAYIVEPHPVGTKLLYNGLPTFTLNYVNDDEALREVCARLATDVYRTCRRYVCRASERRSRLRRRSLQLSAGDSRTASRLYGEAFDETRRPWRRPAAPRSA
ncbi:MAG: hypothetical protein QM775_26575 [Pirellulales bacterium]